MARGDEILFEVTTPAVPGVDENGLWLTTVEAVLASMDEAEAPESSDIESAIAAVSADMAAYANLAKAETVAATFASEVCRATWYANAECYDRRSKLLLPWRVNITAIGSVIEAGIELVAGVDFVLLNGAMLLRLSGDTPRNWSASKIVVPYTAGWTLPDGAPAELRDACTQQVKYRLLTREADPGIRSYTTPDVEQVAYNVPGGDAIDTSGLLEEVKTKLDRYTRKLV